MVRKHQELLEHLDAESAAKARLALALHTAEGEWGLPAGGARRAGVSTAMASATFPGARRRPDPARLCLAGRVVQCRPWGNRTPRPPPPGGLTAVSRMDRRHRRGLHRGEGWPAGGAGPEGGE